MCYESLNFYVCFNRIDELWSVPYSWIDGSWFWMSFHGTSTAYCRHLRQFFNNMGLTWMTFLDKILPNVYFQMPCKTTVFPGTVLALITHKWFLFWVNYFMSFKLLLFLGLEFTLITLKRSLTSVCQTWLWHVAMFQLCTPRAQIFLFLTQTPVWGDLVRTPPSPLLEQVNHHLLQGPHIPLNAKQGLPSAVL